MLSMQGLHTTENNPQNHYIYVKYLSDRAVLIYKQKYTERLKTET